MAAMVLPTPDQTIAWMPALARPAPTRPPMSACELDDGMPSQLREDLPDDGAGERAEDHMGIDDIRLRRCRVPTRFGDMQAEEHERR